MNIHMHPRKYCGLIELEIPTMKNLRIALHHNWFNHGDKVTINNDSNIYKFHYPWYIRVFTHINPLLRKL